MSIARYFEQTIGSGGVVLFPADTVYGLGCDPQSGEAIRRLYAIKRRVPEKSAAVMFFDLRTAMDAVSDLGPRTLTALRQLMPGPVTALVPNPGHHFPLTCTANAEVLGLRVVSVPALIGVKIPVLQSSANLSGGPDASHIGDVDAEVRAAADLVIEGGKTLGSPSTVIDLCRFEAAGEWSIVRQGALSAVAAVAALGSPPA